MADALSRNASGVSVGEPAGGWRLVIAILLAQVVLTLDGAAVRLTDEAYYFLNYLYWRDLLAQCHSWCLL
jgi:hypothetical protein